MCKDEGPVMSAGSEGRTPLTVVAEVPSTESAACGPAAAV